MASVQPEMAAAVVLTSFTLAVIPLPQSETPRNSTRTPFTVRSAFGEEDGGGVGEGLGVGVGTGVGGGTGVGEGVGVGTGVWPFTVTMMRLAVNPPGLAVKPNSTVPPAGILAFQRAGFTTLRFPLRETIEAFQIEAMVAGMVTETDQLVTGALLVLRRTTVPVSPEPQLLSTRVVAVMAADA